MLCSSELISIKSLREKSIITTSRGEGQIFFSLSGARGKIKAVFEEQAPSVS